MPTTTREFTIPPSSTEAAAERRQSPRDFSWRLGETLPTQMLEHLVPFIGGIVKEVPALEGYVVRPIERRSTYEAVTKLDRPQGAGGGWDRPVIELQVFLSRTVQIDVKLGAYVQGRWGYKAQSRKFSLGVQVIGGRMPEINEAFAVAVTGNFAGIDQAIRTIIVRRIEEEAEVLARAVQAKALQTETEAAIAKVEARVRELLFVERYKLPAALVKPPHVHSWAYDREPEDGTFRYTVRLAALPPSLALALLARLPEAKPVAIVSIENLTEEEILTLLKDLPSPKVEDPSSMRLIASTYDG